MAAGEASLNSLESSGKRSAVTVGQASGIAGHLQDLNDLYFYAVVVEHAGFSAAGRALGIPKSRLSKRIARLEDQLGVRLLQRTTRRFVVTEVGERFYQHCRAMLEEAQAAQDAIDELRAEPRGVLRISCPVSLVNSLLAPVLPAFLKAHPKVQLRLLSSNRRVDVIGEGYDVAIRVRDRLDTDATMILRSFGQTRSLLVASPAFIAKHGRPERPESLADWPTLSMFEVEGPQHWELISQAGEKVLQSIQPRMITGDFTALLQAAIQGLGVALVPQDVCAPLLRSGQLEVILPHWETPQGILHFVYPSRRGMLPAVRSFVDFLAEQLPRMQKICESHGLSSELE